MLSSESSLGTDIAASERLCCGPHGVPRGLERAIDVFVGVRARGQEQTLLGRLEQNTVRAEAPMQLRKTDWMATIACASR